MRVKPLVWEDTSRYFKTKKQYLTESECVRGKQYQIEITLKGIFWCELLYDRPWKIQPANTLEDAQKLAYEDYCQFILGQIEV